MSNLEVPKDYDFIQRMTPQELRSLLHVVQSMSFFTRVLDSMPELVGVMTTTRQIVLANQSMLCFLDLDTRELSEGPRPGELVGCVNARSAEHGCGTAAACKQCGALQTIMRAMARGERAAGECRITCHQGDGCNTSLDLMVCCAPFELDGMNFSLFMAQDISDSKRRRALERVFFHDVLNLVNHVSGFAALLQDAELENMQELAQMLSRAACSLTEEIRAQNDLVKAEDHMLAVRHETVDVTRVMDELAELFRAHFPRRARDLVVSEQALSPRLRTDPILLKRVLRNMVKNALEATQPGEVVRLNCAESEGMVELSVHNPGCMSQAVQHQVFQRYFSTKGDGRGLGTYSMRLLTEAYLDGQVDFTSTPEQGTTFYLRLPRG